MSLSFIAKSYRLVCVLSVLHIGSGLAATYLHGVSRTDIGKFIQLISTFMGGVITLERMYHLVPYTRPGRTDTTVFSRVLAHYSALFTYGIIIWPVSALYAYLVESHILIAATAACRAETFMRWDCVPLAANRVLPWAVSATLLSAAYVILRDSLVRHGKAPVPMPSPTPRPWLYSDRDVPAWMTPHVAELWLPSVEEGIVSAEDKAELAYSD
ncbi:hypothetical protein B0H17DRAFT_1071198 [Mycena rosella]|uniref:Uncharacterized protein n=1 Tax=Mycena rosella TaxID=1033263 RepID=A0AAD7GBN1_MYCRO|nr:hypothetical protein B0H17DRAFT_1071198 [Mycena rosella]